MTEPRANFASTLGNFRGIIDLFKNFKDLLPIILEIVECFKGMSPDEKQVAMNIVARFSAETPEQQQEIREQLQQLVS